MPNIAPLSMCGNCQQLFLYYITICIRHFVIFDLEFQNILAQKVLKKEEDRNMDVEIC